MSLENKTVLLIGINGKLEKDLSHLLLENGVKQLIFGCRSKEQGQSIQKKLNSPKQVSILSGFDLLNPKSIEAAVEVLPKKLKIDAIFLQADDSDPDEKQLVNWKGKKVERNVFQTTIGVRLTFQALKNQGLLSQNAQIIVVGNDGKGLPNHIEKPQYHDIEELQNYIGGKTRIFSSAMPLVFLNFSLPFGFWKWQPKRVARNLFGLLPSAS